jgi:hypothetical protein
MSDSWSYLQGATGDAWERLGGTSGDAWSRLYGAVGDAWERLTAAIGPVIRYGRSIGSAGMKTFIRYFGEHTVAGWFWEEKE